MVPIVWFELVLKLSFQSQDNLDPWNYAKMFWKREMNKQSIDVKMESKSDQINQKNANNCTHLPQG